MSHPVEVNWLELWGLQWQFCLWDIGKKKLTAERVQYTLPSLFLAVTSWTSFSHHHHHRHHCNLHWQVQTGRRCSSSFDSGRTRRGRSLWWLSAEPGRKNKKIIIKNKKLTSNNCWTMDKHLHDYHILGGAKRFCCQRAVGSLTTIFWHRTMTLNCLTL